MDTKEQSIEDIVAKVLNQLDLINRAIEETNEQLRELIDDQYATL